MAAIDGREFDIVVFGASGFTGKIVAEKVAQSGVKWAIAGRSRSKLEGMHRRLSSVAACSAFLQFGERVWIVYAIV